MNPETPGFGGIKPRGFGVEKCPAPRGSGNPGVESLAYSPEGGDGWCVTVFIVGRVICLVNSDTRLKQNWMYKVFIFKNYYNLF